MRVNLYELMEAHWRMEAKKMTNNEEIKKEGTMCKKAKETADTKSALFYWDDWIKRKKSVTRKNKPNLPKAVAVTITKILLPGIAPNEKAANYKNRVPYFDWLAKLAGGTDWQIRLEVVRSEYCDACKEAKCQLFEIQ